MIGGRLGQVAFRAVTGQVRMLPDFLVIGAHRGGTSALYYHLTEHPRIAPATTKEVNYFDKNYGKGTWWYRTHFPTLARKRYVELARGVTLITGEASPHYMLHPSVPRRVARVVPRVKLIALLRNPIDRAHSHYRRYVHLGWESLPFAQVSASEEERLRDAVAAGAAIGDDPSDMVGRSSYLARGIYADQLGRWLNQFPRDQMLFLRSEDFYANPARTLEQTLAFLDVPAGELPHKEAYDHYDGYPVTGEAQNGASHDNGHVTGHVTGNETPSDGHDDAPMDPAVRERLRAFFAPHNRRLYDLLDRDMEWD